MPRNACLAQMLSAFGLLLLGQQVSCPESDPEWVRHRREGIPPLLGLSI
jgi:hypothetical protein